MSSHQLARETTGVAEGRGRLAGRRVLVFGAGTRPSADPEAPPGNGRAISILAAREGARVACADLSLEAAEETARLIGGEGVALACDITDEAACRATVDAAAAVLDGLDGLVLNVGTAFGAGIEETSPEDLRSTFAANVEGHYQAVRAALPLLGPGASIVFVSSTAGTAPSASVAYDASKGALEALCRHVASANAGLGIRANAVAPHAVDTPLGRFYAELAGLDSLDDLGLPMRRAGTPWEVAYAVVFLLSNEAAYTTGHTLFVDGGFMLNGVHG